ncbi:MAG TPA: hypothetical protein PLI09_23330 [Candidatus Hydrogenedentes bacterium]|nr:hypothetical protein [Candidatus Hydrogenedentota bacterium]
MVLLDRRIISRNRANKDLVHMVVSMGMGLSNPQIPNAYLKPWMPITTV